MSGVKCEICGEVRDGTGDTARDHGDGRLIHLDCGYAKAAKLKKAKLDMVLIPRALLKELHCDAFWPPPESGTTLWELRQRLGEFLEVDDEEPSVNIKPEEAGRE